MIAADKIALLEAENRRLTAIEQSLAAKIKRQAAHIDTLQRMLIQRRSERFIAVGGDDQLNLFAELDEHVEIEATDHHSAPQHAATKHPGRKPLPAHFPLEVEMITPDAPTESVPFKENQLEREGHILLGFETSERVELRPAQYVRILQKRPRYKNIATGEITVAHARDRVLARSIADETLATDIILKKFLDHQPLYRQAEALKRDHGWELSRATMGKWVERVAVTLRPLYNKLVEQITSTDYVQMDESRIPVLSADKPGATHTGQMWLMRDPVSGAVALRYDKTRSASVPQAVLAKFTGVLQTDGHSSYTKALKALRAQGQSIQQVGCLAHIRGKFFEAREVNPKAGEALVIIQCIYALEARWRHDPPERRLLQRQELLTPVFEELTAWLNAYEHVPIPKTPLGKALGYALRQWPSLEVVLRDGRVQVDNNGIENNVRPLALGRKNYLFAGNHGAAQNIAVLYSLLLSCKAAGVNPRDWLNNTLTRVLQHNVNQVHKLLPSHYQAGAQDVVG